MNFSIKFGRKTKEKIAEVGGIVTGGAGGIGGSMIAVVKGGVMVGTTGPAMAAGLAWIGSFIGGGMLAGVGVCAAVPLATAAAGYGIVKGIEKLV